MARLVLDPKTGEIFGIDSALKWRVYLRLQQLDIPCKYKSHQPLRIKSYDWQTRSQVRSVMMQLTGSRLELASWLERCWEMSDNVRQ
jgi:hypothetical protein